MFDWLKVKSTLEDARNECQKMRATIGKNKLRIEELKNLPPPREELADLLAARMDRIADRYPQKLAEAVKLVTKNPCHGKDAGCNYVGDRGKVGGLKILTACEHDHHEATVYDLEVALFWMLGDQLKAGLRKAVQEMEYPTIVGPAMPKRMTEINNLMAENTSLQAQIDQIETGLTDAGVVHTAVQSQKPARKGDTGVYPPF
ncbi:hypothetical protein SAMN05216403_14120 [Nitrosospira multiformis ATCC 25196]|uniref:Uncharacterized protein n=1 Tax=Nitrosospira multiformis (strain ATCC 25196 / NCIMB 11849 / C 71) TaxID=323848 RepID=Q2YD06_NITMU|nr:hypothetical protein [Nitrosospira multiformis]ABB73365.1 hypothetical protein Nmul_A0056 [Nitrosospira multiformis ATCC 25196]SEG17392.1 hypothetical protein SAMN05216403_14120 [Nitrosospira multiformis ATCC 25196]